jgi:hypothetical protein
LAIYHSLRSGRWNPEIAICTALDHLTLTPLTKLLAQIERVLNVNDLHLVSTAVVEAARDSLVIGPG